MYRTLGRLRLGACYRPTNAPPGVVASSLQFENTTDHDVYAESQRLEPLIPGNSSGGTANVTGPGPVVDSPKADSFTVSSAGSDASEVLLVYRIVITSNGCTAHAKTLIL